MQPRNDRQQPTREPSRPSVWRPSNHQRPAPSMHQEHLLQRRTAAATSRQELEFPHAMEREQQHRLQRWRQRESTTTATRDSHSIHLESAPWLGHQRQQQVQRSTTAAPTPSRRTTSRYQSSSTSETECQTEHHGGAQECRTTKGSSSQHTQATSHSTACSTNSMMTDSTKELLYRRAVKISHSLVRRAHQTIKSVERSQALANGSRWQRGMEVDGYRFVHMSKSGVAVYEDATSIRLEQKQESTRSRFVAVTAVKATLDEFIDAFGRDSELGFTQLNPDMTSCRQIHTLSDEQNQRISVKWMAMQPTWTGSLARRRDFVVLDCEETFEATSGGTSSSSTRARRGWVQMMHSVQLPWCPPLEKVSNIVRGSMYQTGMVVLESKGSPEWLQIVSVVEIDMKGNIADRSQRANALRRLMVLDTVTSTLVQHRLQRLSLMRTKQFNAVKPPKETHCAVCTQRIGLPSLRMHHYCRKCSASVCGTCSRSWQLDPGTKKKTRVCGRCIVAVHKNKPSECNGSISQDIEEVTGSTLPLREYRVSSADMQRGYVAPPPTPHKVSLRSGSVAQHEPPVSTSQPRVSRYFDLPMDPRELGTVSDDDDDDDDDGDGDGECTETIYPFSDTGASVIRSHCRSAKHHHNASLAHEYRAAAVGEKCFHGHVNRYSRTSASLTEAEDDEDDEDDNGNDHGKSASRTLSSQRSARVSYVFETSSYGNSNVQQHHRLQQQVYQREHEIQL